MSPNSLARASRKYSVVTMWRTHSCAMPLSFAHNANSADRVGQTPWSARVPLDPLFVRRVKCLPLTASQPGLAADEGVRPTTCADGEYWLRRGSWPCV